MSGGTSCKCSERKEPIAAEAGSNRPGRLWRVVQRRCNHSAFNGYHRTPSDYSSIECIRCGAHWRTKAPYVDSLPGLELDERFVSRGYKGHAAAMESRGRTPYA